MVVFPNAKINLGLRVRHKRPDGYHELDTVFYPIPICDALEVITLDRTENKEFIFTHSGLDIPGDPDKNLCIKAYQLLKLDFPELPPIRIHLHKNIPMGAGMGGGSADGAFMLRLLNEKYQLGLDQDRLCSYALQLGSDCPFFILNKPVYATGRGECMQEIHCDLSPFTLLVVNPGIHVSTAAAFGNIKLHPNAEPCSTIVSQGPQQWKELLTNDFEESVFPMYPEIGEIKQWMYDNQAIYAAMTGSGSTVVGIFEGNTKMTYPLKTGHTGFFISKGEATKLH